MSQGAATAAVLVKERREELPYPAKKARTLRFLLRFHRRGRLHDGINVSLWLRRLIGRQIRRGLRRSRSGRRFRSTVLCTEDKRRINLNVDIIRLRCRKRRGFRTIRQLRASRIGGCSIVRRRSPRRTRSHRGFWYF